MLGRDRWAKERNNPQEEYNRMHDHMMAIARERDALQIEVQRLIDELYLAYQALGGDMP